MTLHGTLAGVSHAVNRVSDEMEKTMRLAAFKLERTIVLHIQNQDLPHEALNEKYAARKEAQGFSDQILIRTGTAMETVKVQDLSKFDYFVGWVRGTPAGSSSGFGIPKKRDASGRFLKKSDRPAVEGTEDLSNIMTVHEFGSNDGTIPARPTVEPSVDELRDWLEKELSTGLRRALRVTA